MLSVVLLLVIPFSFCPKNSLFYFHFLKNIFAIHRNSLRDLVFFQHIKDIVAFLVGCITSTMMYAINIIFNPLDIMFPLLGYFKDFLFSTDFHQFNWDVIYLFVCVYLPVCVFSVCGVYIICSFVNFLYLWVSLNLEKIWPLFLSVL